MQKFFKYKWAVDGETTAVPNAVDPSGHVSYRQGYGADYSRLYGTDPLAKAPERVKLNAVLQDITGEIQSLQVHGFPDYITSALNGGTAYAYDIGATVRWSDNKNYRNTVAANTNDPSVSGWVLYNNPADAINSATAKTTPVDADQFGIADSAASNVLKKITWGNIKTALTSVFAPIASPAFTGTPTAPTPPAGDNDTSIATTAFINTEISNDVGVANSALVKTALNAGGSAPIYACRAWVNFNGTGTVAIRASGNVSSITDNGVGDYTVNFTTAILDVNYTTVANCSWTLDNTAVVTSAYPGNSATPQATTSVRIKTVYAFSGVSFIDMPIVNVAIFR